MSFAGVVGVCVIGCLGLLTIGMFRGKAQADYFSEHRDEVLTAVRADLEAERYEAVIAAANRYSMAGDPELERLRDDAERLRKEERVAALRAEIAATSDPAAKRRKLEDLLALAPGDADARRQLAEVQVADLTEQLRSADQSVARRIEVVEELAGLEPGNEAWREQLADLRAAEPAEPETEPASNPAEATSEAPPHIPGLTAVDVHGNFTNRGFTLTKDFSDSENLIWRCVEETGQHKMTVEAFGASVTRITLVRATFSNYSRADTDRSCREFMAYAASVPYEGSDPERAQRWVEANLGAARETTIGGVTFELIPSAPRVRMLTIRPEASRSN